MPDQNNATDEVRVLRPPFKFRVPGTPTWIDVSRAEIRTAEAVLIRSPMARLRWRSLTTQDRVALAVHETAWLWLRKFHRGPIDHDARVSAMAAAVRAFVRRAPTLLVSGGLLDARLLLSGSESERASDACLRVLAWHRAAAATPTPSTSKPTCGNTTTQAGSDVVPLEPESRRRVIELLLAMMKLKVGVIRPGELRAVAWHIKRGLAKHVRTHVYVRDVVAELLDDIVIGVGPRAASAKFGAVTPHEIDKGGVVRLRADAIRDAFLLRANRKGNGERRRLEDVDATDVADTRRDADRRRGPPRASRRPLAKIEAAPNATASAESQDGARRSRRRSRPDWVRRPPPQERPDELAEAREQADLADMAAIAIASALEKLADMEPNDRENLALALAGVNRRQRAKRLLGRPSAEANLRQQEKRLATKLLAEVKDPRVRRYLAGRAHGAARK